MKEAIWGYSILAIGIIVLVILLLTQRLATTNEADYYLGREVLAAAMVDAVDYGTFRSTGELVMSKEKFVEIYLRRFAESVSTLKDYQIDFYDIREYPPKASVRIRTNSGVANVNSDSLDVKIDTLTSGVLETTLDRQYIIYAADGIYE
jgi:hypothetical protein